MTHGAILGFVMLCSHIFEQCATVYGGSMGWYSVMAIEMIISFVLFVWLLYRFAKNYSVAVMAQQQTLKMFSYGSAVSYIVAVSALSGVIVGLGRYILHNIIIGHTEYLQAMIASLQAIIKSNPAMSSMAGMYNEMMAQMAAQLEPGIFATIISSIWSYTFWGFITSLILAATISKKPDLFDNQNQSE